MRSKICLFLLIGILATGKLLAQPPRLIIRGDDMGYTHSANEALLKSYQNGILTTVEVMPIAPWFPEVIKICNENLGLDVGVHLSLTSEWTNVKWRPLTYAPSLIDSNGYFYPMIFPNKNYKGKALTVNNWEMGEIEAEIRAQIELAIKNIPHISHVSPHMGWISMDADVNALVEKLTKEYGIDIRPENYGVQRIRYGGAHKTADEKIASFKKMLKSLKKGETYLFVDHPANNSAEQQAVSHIGYNDVALDRDGVTRTLTNPEIKDLIEQLGIELITYKDLTKTKK